MSAPNFTPIHPTVVQYEPHGERILWESRFFVILTLSLLGSFIKKKALS